MTGETQALFVLDANVFITAHRSYYAFDLCPGFWECLIHFCNHGRIASIDRVRMELLGYGDALSDWVREAPAELFLPSTDEDIVRANQEVSNWVSSHDRFSPERKQEFLNGADPWLVAYCRARSNILVTLETPSPNTSKKVKLPNVCDQFGVTPINTFEMLGELGAHFDWRP